MASNGYDYDLFVIGGGSGGVRAARISAGHGAKVALAEEYRMGGTCVIRGCVPKKYMVYASGYAKKVKEARAYGWEVNAPEKFRFGDFMRNMHNEVSRLEGLYMQGQTGAGVTVFEERAELVDAHTVELKSSGQKVTADKILIAVGGHPWRPESDELPGVEHTIDSNGVFELEELPKKIIIAGGGYIAVEFAHIFAGLGADTTLVYRKDKVLRTFDEDIRDHVQQGLLRSGVDIVTDTVFRRIERKEGASLPLQVDLTNGSVLRADAVLMAVGRRPSTQGLGLDGPGVKLGEWGEVIVDEQSRTNVENIFAVGDVTRRMELTPVAIREGHAFADSEFGGTPRVMDHANIPTAIFTQPEVGTVGLSEADAREAFGEVDIYKTLFRPMQHVLSGSDEKVFMKLVVKADDQKVVGAHLIGPDAGEMIQMLGIAVKMGATKQQFDETCAVHPTMAEEIVTMRTKFVAAAD